MCTAITMTAAHFFFGRNLDWKDLCGGKLVITPRNFPFHFKNGHTLKNHYAMIGVAAVSDGYPLYFDGANEAGLAIAGLNFPDHAVYHPFDAARNNLAPYELIPWLLSTCANLEEAKSALSRINLWANPFSDLLPLTPLHWLIADKGSSVVLESTAEGIHIYENPYGVLTNSPPFPYHQTYLRQYLGLSNTTPENRFSQKLDLSPYSFGMGAIGLPGDPSSPSRFVRAAFSKWNSPEAGSVPQAISQFFHILGSVGQIMGVTRFPEGDYEHTVYSSCCDVSAGVYYYKTYQNHSICGIDLHGADWKGNRLAIFQLTDGFSVHMEN